MWWHHIESLDDAISLSLRYDPTWRESLRPGAFPVKYRRVFLPLARGIAHKATGRGSRAPRVEP